MSLVLLCPEAMYDRGKVCFLVIFLSLNKHLAWNLYLKTCWNWDEVVGHLALVVGSNGLNNSSPSYCPILVFVINQSQTCCLMVSHCQGFWSCPGALPSLWRTLYMCNKLFSKPSLPLFTDFAFWTYRKRTQRHWLCRAFSTTMSIWHSNSALEDLHVVN